MSAAPPLGRLESGVARSLARVTDARGLEIRIAPGRTVTVVDVAYADAARLAAELHDLGLVVTAGAGWEGLSACSGLGACANALIDVRAAAARRAGVRAPGAPAEHWSACQRRCGEPRDVAITVTAATDGVTVSTPEHRSDAGAVEDVLALLNNSAALA